MRCYSVVVSSLPSHPSPLHSPPHPPLTLGHASYILIIGLLLFFFLSPWGMNNVGYIDNISTKHIIESKNAVIGNLAIATVGSTIGGSGGNRGQVWSLVKVM